MSMLTAKSHGGWFVLVFVVAALALLWLIASPHHNGANPGKFVSLTLGETETCNNDVGGCPFHSIQAFANGDYIVEDVNLATKEQGKGRLSDEEMVEMKKVLAEVDVLSLLAALNQCERSDESVTSRTNSIDWIALETEVVVSRSSSNFSCKNGEDAARFRNLISKLKSVLKPGIRKVAAGP